MLRRRMSRFSRTTEKFVATAPADELVVRLDIQCTDAVLADRAGDPAAGDDRYRIALTQTDPPAEEEDWDVVAIAPRPRRS